MRPLQKENEVWCCCLVPSSRPRLPGTSWTNSLQATLSCPSMHPLSWWHAVVVGGHPAVPDSWWPHGQTLSKLLCPAQVCTPVLMICCCCLVPQSHSRLLVFPWTNPLHAILSCASMHPCLNDMLMLLGLIQSFLTPGDPKDKPSPSFSVLCKYAPLSWWYVDVDGGSSSRPRLLVTTWTNPLQATLSCTIMQPCLDEMLLLLGGHPVVLDSWWPHGQTLSRLLCPVQECTPVLMTCWCCWGSSSRSRFLVTPWTNPLQASLSCASMHTCLDDMFMLLGVIQSFPTPGDPMDKPSPSYSVLIKNAPLSWWHVDVVRGHPVVPDSWWPHGQTLSKLLCPVQECIPVLMTRWCC